ERAQKSLLRHVLGARPPKPEQSQEAEQRPLITQYNQPECLLISGKRLLNDECVVHFAGATSPTCEPRKGSPKPKKAGSAGPFLDDPRSNVDADAQEGRRDQRPLRDRAAVVLAKQRLEFVRELRRTSSLRRRVERVHRRSVVAPELGDELLGRARVVERVAVSLEPNLVPRDPRAAEALDHVVLAPPSHGTDEARRRRRRIRRTDAQNFGDQRRITRNPIAHHDATTRTGDAHHLLCDVEWLGRKHGAED